MTFKPTNCASMYLVDNATATSISVQNTWYTVSGFSRGALNDWTFSPDKLTVNANGGGEYLIFWAATVTSGGTQTFEMSLAVDGTAKAETKQKICCTTASRHFVLSGTGCFQISGDSYTELKVRNITGTNDITIVDAHVVVHRIL